MQSKAWKAFERRIAKDLGTVRILAKGRAVPDVVVRFSKDRDLYIDAKLRQVVSIKDALETAVNYVRNLCHGIGLAAVCWRKPGKKHVKVFMPFAHLHLLCLWSNGLSVSIPYSIDDFSFTVCVDYGIFKELVNAIERKERRDA